MTSENKNGAQVFVMLVGVKSVLYLQVFPERHELPNKLLEDV